MTTRLIQITKVTALLSIIGLLSCETDKCDLAAPSFEFYQFEYIPADPNNQFAADTLVLWTKFEDCQGDIGIENGEIKNLRTYLFEKFNGEWVKFVPIDSVDSNLLFSQIPTSDKVRDGQKAEGFIEQPFGSIRQTSDTIRFETQLIDRKGNKSEVVTTPEFVFPN